MLRGGCSFLAILLHVKLEHPFSNYTRSIFIYNTTCWECECDTLNLDPHHIFGRVSHSVFNLAPLCRACHSSALQEPKTQSRYLAKTFSFLMSDCWWEAHITPEEAEENKRFLQLPEVENILCDIL